MTGGGSDANFTSAWACPRWTAWARTATGAHTLHEYILVSTLSSG